jgi:nucleotide-binding universal stress UspA family protein
MKIVAWLTDGTWEACVDATRDRAAVDDEVTLLYVTDPGLTEGLHGVYAGLVGRGGRRPDPGDAVDAAMRAAEQTLTQAALARLGREATVTIRQGRVEREVVAAVVGASLLVVARDGNRSRVGPHSLGKATRFVVDHAPCDVLLIWPEAPGQLLPEHLEGPAGPHPDHRPPPPHGYGGTP